MESGESPKVVASTSWVAAFADMAGATDITIIAPNNLQHPPDYDPKASDLAAVADADFVLLAGFEGFAERLQEAAGSDAEVVTVATEYFPDALEAEALASGRSHGPRRARGTAQHRPLHGALGRGVDRVTAALEGKTPVVVSHVFM